MVIPSDPGGPRGVRAQACKLAQRTQQLVRVRNGAVQICVVHAPPRIVLEVVPAHGPREPQEAQAEAALEVLGEDPGPVRARDVAAGGAEVGHARYERVGEGDQGSVR